MPYVPHWKVRFAPAPWLAAALVLLAVPSSAAADLILRDAVDRRVTASAIAGGHVLAREAVRVDPAVLAEAPESLWLELEPGSPRLAFLVDFERTPDGGLVWRGRFPEDDPGYRSITLSLHEGILHGSVEAGAVDYTLRSTRGGAAVLSTLAADRDLGCAVGTAGAPEAGEDAAAGSWTEAVPAGVPTTGVPAAGEGGTAAQDPPSPAAHARGLGIAAGAASAAHTLTILVVHQPGLLEEWGGHPYVVAYAHHAVDSFNTALRNSVIDADAILVGVREWENRTGNIVQVLGQATRSTTLRAWRDEAGADLVVVFTDGNSHGGCGVANLMTRAKLGPQMATEAYSVTRAGCDGFDHKVFAHEIGHNLGAQHLPETATPEALRVFPYALAFGDNRVHTIMANGHNTLVYSNPAFVVSGQPAGIENERDNARALRQTIPIAAAFRAGGTQLPRVNVPPPVPRPPIEVPAHPTELRVTGVTATEVSLRWKDNGSGEIAFRVEGRVEAGGSYAELAEVARDVVSATVRDLEPATAYRFRVLAIGRQANSQYSNEVRATTREAPPTPPGAPTLFAADPLSASAVNLLFAPGERATGHEVEVRTADPAGDRAGETVVLGDEGALVGGLEAATPYTFRVRAVNVAGASEWSGPASATTAGAAGPCLADGSALCLLGGRFEVRTAWRNPHPPFGHGTAEAHAAPASERTGLFTFFDPANVELAVKMLDGRAANGAFWHFYGALSDVEYWVSVRDVEGGETRTYHNPPFELCGRGDTAAFPEAPDPAPASLAASAAVAAAPARVTAAAEEACTPGPQTLCLGGGRFRVEVAWENPHGGGGSGIGHVYDGLGSDRAGHFWFFRPDNLELSVKILDGRAINGHFWIFWGALSDVGYTIRVTDTETGTLHEVENPPFTLCGGALTDRL